MLVEDIPYSYNNKEYVLWMWKGDYWNLGTGSEIGLYQQSAESRTHYDAVDFLCFTQLSTYKYSDGQVYGSYYNWNPVHNKQWWITAFTYTVFASKVAFVILLPFSSNPRVLTLTLNVITSLLPAANS